MTFGTQDPYRGNTTPQQRFWAAQDRLRLAEYALKQAKAEYDTAAEEAAMYNQPRHHPTLRGFGGLF